MVRGLVAALAVGLVGCTASNGALELPTWDIAGEPVELPTTLPTRLVPDEDHTYSLTTQVTVPEGWRGQPLDLHLVALDAKASLVADGEPVGRLEEDHTARYRADEPQAWRIPGELTADGALDLRIDVTHRWTRSRWFHSVPRLLPAGRSDPIADWVETTNRVGAWAATAALGQVGLTCLLVFWVDRRRTHYLFFGIQGLTACAYPLFVVGALQVAFGRWDLPVMEMSLLAALTSSFFFTHGFFGLGRVPRPLLGIMAVAAVLVLVFSGPYSATPIAARAVVLSVAAAVVYQLGTLLGLVWRGERDRVSVWLYIGAWLALAGSTWCDLLNWFGFGEPLFGMRPACHGLTLFALFLSLLLSRRHILSLVRRDDLNTELASRVRQLESHREELRQQITRRSERLFGALSLIERGGSVEAIEPGTVINGRYRVVRPLGEGGMGRVYEVVRKGDGERLALKLATETTGASLARLAREARIASMLDHPDLVRIWDVDVSDLGFMFIAMELVEDDTLRGHQERFGRDDPFFLSVLAQVASGLEALHGAGIVHRDLKPDNVLVDASGPGPDAKLTDFGVSRLTSVGADGSTPTLPPAALDDDLDGDTVVLRPTSQPLPKHGLTQEGLLTGTVIYMAPEAAGGDGAVHAAADVYSFGVLAFEALTGKLPFVRSPLLERLDGREARSPRSLREARPDLEPAIASLIDGCLSLDPEDRPSALELREVLRADMDRFASAE